jgi:hypothetical protein
MSFIERQNMSKIMGSLKIWEHRWLTLKVESFDFDSPSHGLGNHVKEDIKKGENVLVFGGVIIHKSQIKEYWKIMGHVGAQIDDDFFIVPTSREELDNCL